VASSSFYDHITRHIISFREISINWYKVQQSGTECRMVIPEKDQEHIAPISLSYIVTTETFLTSPLKLTIKHWKSVQFDSVFCSSSKSNPCLLTLIHMLEHLYNRKSCQRNFDSTIKQVYNQQTARIKNRKHSNMFQLLSLAIFRQYQYQKIYTA